MSARMLDRETQVDARRHHDLLIQLVEIRRDARENARSHFGAVRIAVQLLVGGLADP